MRLKYVNAHRAKDLKRTTLVISSAILALLKRKNEIKLNDLYLKINENLTMHQKDYMVALNFLFALGAIEYIIDHDAIRYLK